jgi:hypothetical protein
VVALAVVALAVVALGAVAIAISTSVVPVAAEPKPREASVSLGAGAMTSRGSLGDESVFSVTASGNWFPGGGRLGARLQLNLARTGGGTTYVNSDRMSGTTAALGAARQRLIGPFYAVAGVGPGLVLVRSHHQVVIDEETIWATHPALAWTAGIEMVYQQLVVRADHAGAWSDVSRDLIHSIHVGTVF